MAQLIYSLSELAALWAVLLRLKLDSEPPLKTMVASTVGKYAWYSSSLQVFWFCPKVAAGAFRYFFLSFVKYFLRYFACKQRHLFIIFFYSLFFKIETTLYMNRALLFIFIFTFIPLCLFFRRHQAFRFSNPFSFSKVFIITLNEEKRGNRNSSQIRTRKYK